MDIKPDILKIHIKCTSISIAVHTDNQDYCSYFKTIIPKDTREFKKMKKMLYKWKVHMENLSLRDPSLMGKKIEIIEKKNIP